MVFSEMASSGFEPRWIVVRVWVRVWVRLRVRLRLRLRLRFRLRGGYFLRLHTPCSIVGLAR